MIIVNNHTNNQQTVLLTGILKRMTQIMEERNNRLKELLRQLPLEESHPHPALAEFYDCCRANDRDLELLKSLFG